MFRYFSITAVCLVALVSNFWNQPTWGQSGNRSAGSGSSQPAARARPAPGSAHSGSGSHAQASGRKPGQTQPGLAGYCPVCLRDMKKWVKGNPAYQAVYDGHVYSFMSEEQKNTFLANPDQYVPVLGGDCVTCLAKMGKRMPGDIRHAAYHQGRLYLFAGEDQKQMFLQDPKAYANADLALNGNCPVCRVEMHKEVPGDARITTTRGGLRYYFPSAEQRKMFISNPKKYGAP